MTERFVDPSPFRVRPGTSVSLAELDTRSTGDFEGRKTAGRQAMALLNGRFEVLQELLYAEARHKVLVVLQAMDSGGKDGTIRHVFDGVNPQGVKVAAFKRPTERELAHDYLWRVHQHTPARGEIVIFNRSHYEDVLVVRVHDLVPKEVWSRRYDHIRCFEQMMADEGVTVLKFFLHISEREQKARLQSRLDEPEKHWKFDVGDLAERSRWDEYIAAYEAVLEHTSTPAAPWYIVPADRKWFRNLLISQILVDTLEGLHMRYPAPAPGLDEIVIE